MAEVTNSKLLNTGAGIPKKNACIVLVKTEWNGAIVDELEKGCREKLEELKVGKIITLMVRAPLKSRLAIKNNGERAGKKKRPNENGKRTGLNSSHRLSP